MAQLAQDHGLREAKAPRRLVDRKIGNGGTAYLARYAINAFFTWVMQAGGQMKCVGISS